MSVLSVVYLLLLGAIGGYVREGPEMPPLAGVAGGLICGVLLSNVFLIVLNFVSIAKK